MVGAVGDRTFFGARLNGALIVGMCMLLVLFTMNLLAYRFDRGRKEGSLVGAPPHSALVRWLLWTDDDSRSDPEFLSRPLPVTVAGEDYSYQPVTSVPLDSFSATLPYGLELDTLTGQISGVPQDTGRADIVLTGFRSGGGSVVQQEYKLWVDKHYRLLGVSPDGYDVLRSLFVSTKVTVVPALLAVLLGVGGGVIIGALGGYYGGLPRQLLQGLTTAVQSIPGLLLVYLAAELSSFNLVVTMLAIGVVMLPETANGIREMVERFRERDFVEAARELGMNDRAILWNELIWHNGRTFLASRTLQGFSFAILLEITLRFIGKVDPNATSLGQLLITGRGASFDAVLLVPALSMLLLVVATFAILERGISAGWARRR